jgi:hypothetical protein
MQFICKYKKKEGKNYEILLQIEIVFNLLN